MKLSRMFKSKDCKQPKICDRGITSYVLQEQRNKIQHNLFAEIMFPLGFCNCFFSLQPCYAEIVAGKQL